MKLQVYFYLLGCVLGASGAAAELSVNPVAANVTNDKPVITVAGAGTKGVSWSLTPNIGSLSTTSTQAVYSAPSSVSQVQIVQVKATDIINPALTVISTITVNPAVKVAVQPAVVDLTGPGVQQFSASVSGSANTGVSWSISPATGSISASGLYTAPAVAVDAVVTVKAISRANGSVSATAAVRLHAASRIQFTTQANGLKTLTVSGTNYNYPYAESLVTSVSSVNGAGQGSRTAPSCTSVFDATSVTKTCPNGSAPLTVRVDFSTPDSATISASIQVTNNSSTDTISSALLSLIGVDTPQYDLTKSRVLYLDATNPISYVNYISGQWAIWNTMPTPDVTIRMTCGWTTFCKNQPEIRDIAPGQRKTTGFSVRFSSNVNLSTVDLAPEAYAAYRGEFPPLVNWPDRRPIMAWFISDYTQRSAINPRGYLQLPALDVSNTANFTSQVVATANKVLGQMKSRPVQPQGLILWDLEGQEFIQPTTYVGDPRVFSKGYAPEMDAAADQMFAVFRNAGYKVGVTLRAQQLQWGTQLPATCHYDVNNDFKDYYIKADNPFGQRFFACYDPAGVNWSLIPQGNGGQTSYTNLEADKVTALLISKVAYARARWGTTIYYVDSAVWSGGATLPADIFRQLQAAFPDSLFIPEQSSLLTMGATLPFSDPKNASNPKFAPVTWRYAYPNGALGTYLANCQGSCWTTNYNDLLIGQRVGDLPIYPQPIQMSSSQLQQIESMILSARSQASSITVTDSTTGSSYSYHGSPGTIYKYPVKMRVYFAGSPSQAAGSSVYCESGQWLGGNTCKLDLSGLPTAQIRYYDFAGNLVSSQTPGPR